MNIYVNSYNAARTNNSQDAHDREQTRMAMLAWCLSEMGHAVWMTPIANRCRAVRQHFSHLEKDDVPRTVDMAITCTGGRGRFAKDSSGINAQHTIAFKTRCWVANDKELISACDVLMGYEIEPTFAEHPKVMHIPFPVHSVIIDQLEADGLFVDYMLGEVSDIRQRYGATPRNGAGFIGAALYDRPEKMDRIQAAMPEMDWDVVLTSEGNIPPIEYLLRTGRWRVGMHLPGETPDSFRFSELAMLGVVTVVRRGQMWATPAVTDENAILLDDWDDRTGFLAGWERAEDILVAADQAWYDGWSPMGQAKQLLRRLG